MCYIQKLEIECSTLEKYSERRNGSSLSTKYLNREIMYHLAKFYPYFTSTTVTVLLHGMEELTLKFHVAFKM